MAGKKPPFGKYGLFWKTTDLVLIEMEMIRRTKGSKDQWLHYKALQQAIWPDHDHHRWSDLVLQELVQNTFTTILGPGSSGKTHYVSKFALCEYWIYPKHTTVLISSTDMRGLELRIWGEIRKMFREALERYPYLPGHALESRHAIVTEDIEEGEVRDLRNGIICFVGGTPVDTPKGPVPIESIRVGDLVINALGCGIVKAIGSRKTNQIVRVRISGNKTIDCTPNHPFLTRRGWVRAIDLHAFDMLLSVHETMSIMRTRFGTWLSQSEVLLRDLSKLRAFNNLLSLQQDVQTVEPRQWLGQEVLQHCLRGSMGRTESQSENSNTSLRDVRKGDGIGSFQQEVLFHSLSRPSDEGALCWMRSGVCVDSAKQDAPKDFFLQSLLQMEMDQSNEWWQESDTHPSRETAVVLSSRSRTALHGVYRSNPEAKQHQASLPDRLGISRCEIGGGSRRRSASHPIQAETRCQENFGASVSWVESVEIIESESAGQSEENSLRHTVYNLEVEGHPSYSVCGVIVHNCIPCLQGGRYVGIAKFVGVKNKHIRLFADELQFMGASYLDSVANLTKNVDFKGAGMGNPVDPMDQLGKAAEPVEGWSSLPEPEKTTTWKTRFMSGRCVNLVGTDSPNLDFPGLKKPKYPYLIDQAKIEETERFWGKESLQYYSQCKGVMKVGLQGRRVITKELCRQHDAFEGVLWKNNDRTRIYALDIAFGGVGGDRCVGGYGEFGTDVDGNQVLLIHPPVLVPVSVKEDKIPEDQIADWVHMSLESLAIQPQNCFYDSTGRGSVGASFARVFGHIIPVPIEFGGRPSIRAVRDDFFITDQNTHERRHKRCDEHYSKFVTELWFSVRYTIESGQFRGMTDEVCEEGCMREWKMTFGNKIEIESKEDTRDRMGRSPDLFDWLVTLVEGARQRGFRIRRLGSTPDEMRLGFGRGVLDELAQKWNKVERSKRLQVPA